MNMIRLLVIVVLAALALSAAATQEHLSCTAELGTTRFDGAAAGVDLNNNPFAWFIKQTQSGIHFIAQLDLFTGSPLSGSTVTVGVSAPNLPVAGGAVFGLPAVVYQYTQQFYFSACPTEACTSPSTVALGNGGVQGKAVDFATTGNGVVAVLHDAGANLIYLDLSNTAHTSFTSHTVVTLATGTTVQGLALTYAPGSTPHYYGMITDNSGANSFLTCTTAPSCTTTALAQTGAVQSDSCTLNNGSPLCSWTDSTGTYLYVSLGTTPTVLTVLTLPSPLSFNGNTAVVNSTQDTVTVFTVVINGNTGTANLHVLTLNCSTTSCVVLAQANSTQVDDTSKSFSLAAWASTNAFGVVYAQPLTLENGLLSCTLANGARRRSIVEPPAAASAAASLALLGLAAALTLLLVF